MLTRIRGSAATRASWMLAVVLMASALVFTGARGALADPNCGLVETADGKLVYQCSENRPGGDASDGGNSDGGGNGGGGNAGPTCDLSRLQNLIGAAERYCEGENACWIANPPFLGPTEDPPSEDAVYIYKECLGPNGESVFDGYLWLTDDEPQGPSVEELALQAFGSLETPGFSLAHSPPLNSIIYIDTWWWADGPSNGEISSGAALGVVAIGTPSHIEVDPGDGSGVMTCDFVTAESDACSHTYNRAGDYTSRGRLVYDVHFEQNGSPLDIAGLPDLLESGWQESTITVAESQAVVVP